MKGTSRSGRPIREKADETIKQSGHVSSCDIAKKSKHPALNSLRGDGYEKNSLFGCHTD